VCASKACALAVWVDPVIFPGGKPVMALPGEMPRSPVTIDSPVLVTVEAPRTAKGAALPRLTAWAWMAPAKARASPSWRRLGMMREQKG